MAAAVSAPALAQPKPAERLAFEVTSVKPNTTEARPSFQPLMVGTRFSATNMPLGLLLASAYNLPFQSVRVIGMPQWAMQERFDIDAKAADSVLPAGLPASQRRERIRALMQSLLADRFKLVVHRESKEMSYYALLVGKNGPKMSKSAIEEKDCVENPPDGSLACHAFMGGQGRGLHAKAVNMRDLVGYIENWTDHPVLDKTSIEGLFAIETEGWVSMRQPPQPPPPPPAAGATPAAAPTMPGPPPPDGDPNDPTRPTLFLVLSRLGLELKPEKGPVEVFAIDHLERPTAN